MYKNFTPFDQDINLVSKPSDFDLYDDEPDVLRAVLSCGHVTHPVTLTDCCKAQLERGKTELKCPVCNAEWPYAEVRQLAKLTDDERESFEYTLGTNTIKKLVDYKNCPGCGIFIERDQTSNLCVKCLHCTAKNGKLFEFCWQCEREWKGHRPCGDKCDNVGCKNLDVLDMLSQCTEITLKSVHNVLCPSIRACPFCGILIELIPVGCKIILCVACNREFCFICLKPAEECLKTSTNFVLCTAGVAPRQISSVANCFKRASSFDQINRD